RSVTQLHLPPRFALTVRVKQSEAEEAFYLAISAFVRERAAKSGAGVSRFTFRRLLETAGSSHLAALRMLERMPADGDAGMQAQVAAAARLGREIKAGSKTQRVVELLKASSEQKVLFVNTLATLEHLHEVLSAQQIPHV